MTAATNPGPVGHRRWRTKPTPRKISAPSRPPCPSRRRFAASSPCSGGSSRYSPPAASVSGRGEVYRDPDTAMTPRPSPTPSSHRVLANLVAHRRSGRFPMIGKNFRAVFGKQKGQRGKRLKREEGLQDNCGNFRQLFSALKSMKTASRTGTLICDKSIHKQRAYHSSGIQQIHPFALQGMSKN